MTLFYTPTWQVGGVRRTACFFVLVISFILSLENFLSSLEALIELNNLREALGSRVEPLDDELFLPLLQE